MNRLFAVLLLVPVIALMAGLSGCGEKETKKRRPSTDGSIASTDDPGKSSGPKSTIKPGTAKVVGKVVYEGEVPDPGTLVPVMTKHNDSAHCLAGKEFEKQEQTWMIGKDKGVANAVIWINPPDGSELEVTKETKDAVLDQPHCVYVPHVLAMKPGQKLLVKNSAAVNHNTKLDVDTFVNMAFTQTIPPQGSSLVELKPQDKAITVVCDIHPWMKAKIWVLPHQYVVVTKDDGSFAIDNVPEGSELSVVAWHEGVAAPGYFYNGKKGTKHIFKAGENPPLTLKVSAAK